MTDERAPQARPNSTNICPNAKRRALTEMATCDPDALTYWGYCTECWELGNVPAKWADQVDLAIVSSRDGG